MCKELGVTPKSGVLHFRRANLCVQSSQVMLEKLSHQTSDFEALSLYPFGIHKGTHSCTKISRITVTLK